MLKVFRSKDGKFKFKQPKFVKDEREKALEIVTNHLGEEKMLECDLSTYQIKFVPSEANEERGVYQITHYAVCRNCQKNTSRGFPDDSIILTFTAGKLHIPTLKLTKDFTEAIVCVLHRDDDVSGPMICSICPQKN